MAKNDGGPAFPATRWDDNIRQEVPWRGMTLRDYFAAKTMCALLASPNFNLRLGKTAYAVESYEIADAMIGERDK